MRIIAGDLKGQVFDSPKTELTHPMSDKIRGAIFNALGDIVGLSILDAFAGTGAISFEALSRGATHATLLDNDHHAGQTLHSNVTQLKLVDRVTIMQISVNTWSHQNPGQTFDLVFADPPYNDTQIVSIQALENHIKLGGMLILSWPAGFTLPRFESLEMIREKTYGDAQLAFYRKVS